MEAWELDALERAAECLARARYAIALTGAGLSVESGIPPFRGPGGLWTKHGEPPMNGYQRFLADPRKAWEDRLNPSGPMRELWEALGNALLPPRCPRCDGLLKGDTVSFGEPIPPDVLAACSEEAERADCMIVAGT